MIAVIAIGVVAITVWKTYRIFTSVRDTEKVPEQLAEPRVIKNADTAFFAAIGSFLFDRSLLYVYDSKGALVYHELLGEEAETIAVRPGRDGTEELLVGGKRTIWRFFRK